MDYTKLSKVADSHVNHQSSRPSRIGDDRASVKAFLNDKVKEIENFLISIGFTKDEISVFIVGPYLIEANIKRKAKGKVNRAVDKDIVSYLSGLEHVSSVKMYGSHTPRVWEIKRGLDNITYHSYYVYFEQFEVNKDSWDGWVFVEEGLDGIDTYTKDEYTSGEHFEDYGFHEGFEFLEENVKDHTIKFKVTGGITPKMLRPFLDSNDADYEYDQDSETGILTIWAKHETELDDYDDYDDIEDSRKPSKPVTDPHKRVEAKFVDSSNLDGVEIEPTWAPKKKNIKDSDEFWDDVEAIESKINSLGVNATNVIDAGEGFMVDYEDPNGVVPTDDEEVEEWLSSNGVNGSLYYDGTFMIYSID